MVSKVNEIRVESGAEQSLRMGSIARTSLLSDQQDELDEGKALEDAVLRDTETDQQIIFDNIITYEVNCATVFELVPMTNPVLQPFVEAHFQMEQCRSDRDRMLSLCRQSEFCRRGTRLLESLESMCSRKTLGEMSTEAVEQIGCILGVILMCCSLYILLCLAEKAIICIFWKEEKQE